MTDAVGPHPVTAREPAAAPPELPHGLEEPPHWSVVVDHCGETLADGLYRFQTSTSAQVVKPLLVLPFGFGWLGRQFAIAEGAVTLFEPGTGERLEIPGDLESFHSSEIVVSAEAALAQSFFDEWRRRGNRGPAFDECVGYRVPLFLGGSDDISNLKLTDTDVYWELSTQLVERARRLRPDTRITETTIE